MSKSLIDSGYKDNKVDFKEYIIFLNEKAKAANINFSTYKTIDTLISVLNDEKLINFKEAEFMQYLKLPSGPSSNT